MPELADLEKQLEEAILQRQLLQPLLNETEGWDAVPQAAIDEFVHSLPARRMLTAAFNPDQARDERGRFSSSGAGGGGKPAAKPTDRAGDVFSLPGERPGKNLPADKARVRASTTIERMTRGEKLGTSDLAALGKDLGKMRVADLKELQDKHLLFGGRAIRKAAIAKELHDVFRGRVQAALEVDHELIDMTDEKIDLLAEIMAAIEERNAGEISASAVPVRRMLIAAGVDFVRDEGGRFATGEGGGGLGGHIKRLFKMGGQAPAPAPDTFAGKLQEALKTPVRNINGLPVVKVDGKEYLFKPPGRFSESEVLAAQQSKEAGVDVADVKVEILNGQKVSVSEWIDGTTRIADIGDRRLDHQAENNKAKAEALSKVPHEEIERHALFDYAIGYTDSHEGQYLIKEKKLIGLDKDFSFSTGKGENTDFDRPVHLRLLGDRAFTFSAAEVGKMAAAADRIAANLESQGRGKDATGVRNRAAVLRELTRLHGDRPTLGQLEDLGSGFQLRPPPQRNVQGSFGDDVMRITILQGSGEPHGTITSRPKGGFDYTGDVPFMESLVTNNRRGFVFDKGRQPAAPAELLRYMATEGSHGRTGRVRIESAGLKVFDPLAGPAS